MILTKVYLFCQNYHTTHDFIPFKSHESSAYLYGKKDKKVIMITKYSTKG